MATAPESGTDEVPATATSRSYPADSTGAPVPYERSVLTGWKDAPDVSPLAPYQPSTSRKMCAEPCESRAQTAPLAPILTVVAAEIVCRARYSCDDVALETPAGVRRTYPAAVGSFTSTFATIAETPLLGMPPRPSTGMAR